MSYQATMTQKGQITIPKEIRKVLKLRPFSKVILEINGEEVKIKSAVDILELADKFNPSKKISALKIREKMEKKYERV